MHLSFEYWSDPLCIWAFVAQSKLDHVTSTWREHVRVHHRIVPVFGSVPQRFRDGVWASSGPAGKAETTRAVAATHGVSDVSGQVWIDDPPASSWSSGAAVKGAFALEGRGEAPRGFGEAYLLAMRRRFFIDNQNVARRGEQLGLAESLGVDPGALATLLDDGTALAALYEDDVDAKASHVRGSPTYVFDGGRTTLYGNFPARILDATVEELIRGLGVGATPC